MTLSEALRAWETECPAGSRPGLSRTQSLLDALGHPEKELRYVHIAGTNGKGSTAAMIASVLKAAGIRTGLFTSPALRRVNEQIRVDGEMISDAHLADLFGQILPIACRQEDRATQFEFLTAAALVYFRQQGCRMVVLECGMGGELDATNVVPAPDVAVLTRMGLDHTAWLGDTVEAIARTKAGIVKPGSACVLYPCAQSVESVVRERCRQVQAACTVVDAQSMRFHGASMEGQWFDWNGYERLFVPLLGAHQRMNAAAALTAVAALRERGWDIPEAAVRQGLADVCWPGRLQLLSHRPAVVLDGGHNPQCLQALREALAESFCENKVVFVFGCLADKDVAGMIDELLPVAQAFYTITPDSGRALSADALAERLTQKGARAEACGSVAQAIRRAADEAGLDGVVCICGSLYNARGALAWAEGQAQGAFAVSGQSAN